MEYMRNNISDCIEEVNKKAEKNKQSILELKSDLYNKDIGNKVYTSVLVLLVFIIIAFVSIKEHSYINTRIDSLDKIINANTSNVIEKESNNDLSIYSIKLDKCPMCGSSKIITHLSWDKDVYSYYVQCDSCGLKTRNFEDEYELNRYWSERRE